MIPPQFLTNLGNTHSPLIGMHLPDGLYKDKRLQLQLQSSSFRLEDYLPHPDGTLTLTAHERGFRITSAYQEVLFSTALAYDAVESAEALLRHQVKRRPDFSIAICVLLSLLFLLFTGHVGAILTAMIITAILGIFFQAETVYRTLRIRFIEDGGLYEFTLRYPKHKTEEVHSYFVRFIPDKFRDPLAGR